MGKIKGLIALLILGGGFYVGWKMIPPYFHKYEFQDDLDEIARRNSYTHKTDDEVRASVIQQAGTRDIPLREEQVNITRTKDGIGISVRYQVQVDLMVHRVDLDFTVNSMNNRAY